MSEANADHDAEQGSKYIPRLPLDALLAFGGLTVLELAPSPLLKGLGAGAMVIAELDLCYQGRQSKDNQV